MRPTMGARVLLIDNYDSFVYNLVQELGELGADPVVYRNDAIDIGRDRAGCAPTPSSSRRARAGPSRPGISMEVIATFAGGVPILGVCLGHQCIGEVFGGRMVSAPTLMHGKTSQIHHDGTGVFAGLPNPFVATRYHSLVVDPDVGARRARGDRDRTSDGVVMGLRHRDARRRGRPVPPRVDPHRCGPGPPRATSSASSRRLTSSRGAGTWRRVGRVVRAWPESWRSSRRACRR